MKALRTDQSNLTLTLNGPDGKPLEGRELPAMRFFAYDADAGETEQDARLAFETIWQPDDHEARQLEAGACVRLIIHGPQHPPVSVGVTEAIVPERELIDRGHVDRALGYLYQEIRDRMTATLASEVSPEEVGLPGPVAMADLWTEAVKATAIDPDTVAQAATIVLPDQPQG